MQLCIFIVARAGKCRCCSGTAPHAAEKRAKRHRKARQITGSLSENQSNFMERVSMRRQWWWVAAGGGGSAAVLSRTNVMIIQAFVAVGVLRHV